VLFIEVRVSFGRKRYWRVVVVVVDVDVDIGIGIVTCIVWYKNNYQCSRWWWRDEI